MLYNSSILSRLFRWFLRFRHRCGYGIHSPFAFNLVTGVIYEKGSFYAYEKLPAPASDKYISTLRLKDNRLLFRLVNATEPSVGIIFGDDLGSTLDYIKAGRTNCRWYLLSPLVKTELAKLFSSLGRVDFVYLDDPSQLNSVFELCLPYLHDHSLFVVRSLYASHVSLAAWMAILKNPKVRVSFDLYDFGLLYFEQRLNKEDYLINYF